MSFLPKSLVKVIESFEKLPGIGQKTATRLAFYLLRMPQTELDRFGESVINLKKFTKLCSICKNVTETDPCPICYDPARDQSTICVVQETLDVLAIEKSRAYHGLYHILHGAIDPLNNIGPDEIYLDSLVVRVKKQAEGLKEIIIATNHNMEGEATALYIQKQLSNYKLQTANHELIITRLAHGLPVGADIEYADELTLTRALEGRRTY